DLRVHEHVRLAALVRGQRLGELARRRATRHGGGREADRAHRGGHALGVVDPGGVDDPRCVAEPALVEVGGREVERVDVEGCGELALVEVAADDVDLPERGDRLHAHAPEWRHDTPAHGFGKREVGDLGGEYVADVLLEQL